MNADILVHTSSVQSKSALCRPQGSQHWTTLYCLQFRQVLQNSSLVPKANKQSHDPWDLLCLWRFGAEADTGSAIHSSLCVKWEGGVTTILRWLILIPMLWFIISLLRNQEAAIICTQPSSWSKWLCRSATPPQPTSPSFPTTSHSPPKNYTYRKATFFWNQIYLKTSGVSPCIHWKTVSASLQNEEQCYKQLLSSLQEVPSSEEEDTAQVLLGWNLDKVITWISSPLTV